MTPEKSIRLGIGLYKQLRDRQAQTGCDIETMIQAYNYGPGFINFVMANGGKYSEDLAYQFSSNMKKKYGLKVYGDPSYVSKWKKYIASESIRPIDSSNFQTIHDEAYKYIGKAYVFGGSDPNTGFGLQTTRAFHQTSLEKKKKGGRDRTSEATRNGKPEVH